MKKIISVSALCLALGSLLFSCTLETSDNGKLDGFWKLTRVDTLATGGVLDLRESGIFWAIQMNLMSVQDKYVEDSPEYLFRFEHKDGKLTLSEPHKGVQYKGDEPIDDVEVLKPYGINQLTETFTVETLNGSSLYLSTDKLRLSFTRF